VTGSRLLSIALVLAVLAAGCLGSSNTDIESSSSTANGSSTSAGFTEPVEVTSDAIRGFEPSIEVAPNGDVVVTAHKASRVQEEGTLSSLLWVSSDGRESFQRLTSPAQAHEAGPAQEGDVAIDASGRLTFVDTYAAGVSVHRWGPAGQGFPWQSSRPALPSAHALDDRAWIAAQGDGQVYFLAHDVGAAPDPAAPSSTPTGAREILHRSTDAGQTFHPVKGFTEDGWCTLDAPRQQPGTVHVSCTTQVRGEETQLVAYTSQDGGSSFSRSVAADFQNGPSQPFGSAVASDATGTPFHAWIDGTLASEEPSRVRLAYPQDAGGWATINLTPWEGEFAMPWVAATGSGEVAVVFYGQGGPNATAEGWYPYVTTTQNARAPNASWTTTPLMDRPVSNRTRPPADFFQVAFGPEGRVHVAFGADDHPCPPEAASLCVESRGADSVWYTRQIRADAAESS